MSFDRMLREQIEAYRESEIDTANSIGGVLRDSLRKQAEDLKQLLGRTALGKSALREYNRSGNVPSKLNQ